MFTIDFTKPWLYKDVIYFNQGNLATNNILRCKLVTGGDTSLEGYIASVTFKTLSHAEINTLATIVDKVNCVIDIKFPSNSLEVGVNELEVLLNKGDDNDKVVVQSPKIKYEVWQGLTTGNGIQGDNNYPILIDLISSVNNVVRVANDASVTAKVALSQASNMRDSIEDALVRANETIKNTNNAKNEALESVNEVNRAIAAGTQDLEVKAAREDAEGVTHDTLALRLKSDLKIGEKSLKQEVLDLSGLKEVQEMSYSTDKGYLVCKETKNGVIKDLKIKGKSLINIMNPGEFSINLRYPFKEFTNIQMLKPSTLYTYIILGDTKNISQCALFDSAAKEIIFEKTNGTLFTFITPNNLLFANDIQNYIYKKSNVDEFTETEIKSWKVLILEGDHTQNPPKEYFEGIASVGTGVDEIEVSSIKADGNLLDYDKLIKASNTEFFVDNGDIHVTSVNPNAWSYVTFKNIKVEPNTKYYVKCDEVVSPQFSRLYITDGKGGSYSLLDKYGNVEAKYYEFTTNDTGLVNFAVYSNNASKPASTTIYKKLRLVKKECEYTPYKEDKKPLLFKDVDGTWKPIPILPGYWENGKQVWGDMVDSVKGKWYKKNELYVLNGTQTVTISSTKENTVVFKTSPIFTKGISNGRMICDVLPVETVGDVEKITKISPQKDIYIALNKSKASTVEEFNSYVATNNISFIYEIKEEVYDIAPTELDAYDNETMILSNSGVINAPIEFKIASYISNLVLLNQKRIKELENEIYKSQDIQDIMILENDLRLMDIEFALEEIALIKLNLRSDDMFRGVTEFEFLKGRILSGSHTDDYLEKCINKYKKAGRLTDEEYDALYDMIYPPVYDVLADK